MIKQLSGYLNRSGLEAAALSYAALFSFVPLLSLFVVLLQAVIPQNSVAAALRGTFYRVMGGTFEPKMIDEMVNWVNLGISQFYAFNFSFLGIVSIFLLCIIAISLLRRIQLSSFRNFEVNPPTLKVQLKRSLLCALGILATLLVATLVPLAKHYLHMHGLALFSIQTLTALLQLVTVSVFLTSLYPYKSRLRTAILTTLISLVVWKTLTWAFKIYMLHSVSSRSIFGAWAFFPLLLVWVYSQFMFLFIALRIMHMLNSRYLGRLKTKNRLATESRMR
jgi:membrane protein